MYYLKLVVALLIFLQANTCQKKNQVKTAEVTQKKQSADAIDSIVIHTYGGMLGVDEKVMITPEKVVYQYKNFQNPKIQQKEIMLDNKTWLEINGTFDKTAFENLEEGSTQVVFDGQDEVYRVVGSFGEMSKLNPQNPNKAQEEFFDAIGEVRSRFANMK